MASGPHMNCRFVLVLGVLHNLTLGVIARTTTIPPGTELHVRLTSEVTSEKPSGQPVTGVVIVPVFVNGVATVSAGTRLTGNTADARSAKPATQESTEQPATVRIQFTNMQDQAGHARPVYCTAGVGRQCTRIRGRVWSYHRHHRFPNLHCQARSGHQQTRALAISRSPICLQA